MLRLVAKPLGRLRDKEEQSRDAPDVATRVPPRLRRPVPPTPPDPALARLPRP
jgi:hypothetical protein